MTNIPQPSASNTSEVQASSHIEGQCVSIVTAALKTHGRKKVNPLKIVEDAQRIAAVARRIKAPTGHTEFDWFFDVCKVSDLLRPYGLDISIEVKTSIVPRKNAKAWAKR